MDDPTQEPRSGGADPRTDAAHLTARQYRDAGNLDARIALHRRFAERDEPWTGLVMDALLERAPGPARVLEVGCGSGALWREQGARVPPGWSLVLVDLSSGMLAAAREAVAAAGLEAEARVADVQALPFDDDAFDLVIANHMLYHAPDPARAVAELRRVLAPGGALMAATNGPRHMAGLRELLESALPPDAPPAAFGPAALSFRLDNGAATLRASFERVEVARVRNDLIVTEAEPLVAYAASMGVGATDADGTGAAGAADGAGEGGIERLRREVEARLAQGGAVRIERDSGWFLAS